jgi:hypothetical protein
MKSYSRSAVSYFPAQNFAAKSRWGSKRPGEFVLECAALCIRTPNVISYGGLISNVVPNRWHGVVLRVAQPGRGEYFPTADRCNTLY